MKLGTNKDAMPAFIEQQVKQSLPPSINPLSSAAPGSSAASVATERVHVKMDEKISLTCGKDGGVQNLEVLGVLSIRVAGEEDGRIKVALRNGDNRNLQLQVLDLSLSLRTPLLKAV